MFVFQQIVLKCLKHRTDLVASGEGKYSELELSPTKQKLVQEKKILTTLINETRKILYGASYTIELLAFPITTFQYVFIELSTIVRSCNNL